MAKLPFLVTPKELQTAFEPFKLVINNACVPVDYTNTPVEEKDIMKITVPFSFNLNGSDKENFYQNKSRGKGIFTQFTLY